MSRTPTSPTIEIRPGFTVYSALLLAGIVAALLGLVALWLRAAELFPPNGLL